MNLCAKSQRKGMNNLRGIKEHFEVIDTDLLQFNGHCFVRSGY